MPPEDGEPSDKTVFQRVYSFLDGSLNFYRLHILYLCVLFLRPFEWHRSLIISSGQHVYATHIFRNFLRL
jgi:hypothetical protein